jgi:hypothetical protein
MKLAECRIGNSTYVACDEYKLVEGNTYLVHTDHTGYFLGKFKGPLRVYSSEYVFHECTFYKKNYRNMLVADTFKKEVMVDLFSMITREFKWMIPIEEECE